MEKKTFKGLIKKAVVCVMCTLTLVGGSIGLSGCVTITPNTPIKETKDVNISTTMNAPTEVEFVEVGNGQVKIVWNYQATENVKAEEGTKFSVKHENGVSEVEKSEITVEKTVIDDGAVKIKTKAASSYAGADKVEEDKVNNKEITTKTTYSFADSAEVSATYKKEEVKQEIQLKAPTNFEVTNEGILKFAVDAKAKTFNLAITVDGRNEVYENQNVKEAEKSASFEIVNYDKAKKYDFEVKLKGYETETATYLDSASAAFTKDAEQVKDMTFAEFETIAAEKIEIDNWNSYNIDKIFAIERKGMDLRLIVQTSSGKEISYRIYKTTLPVNIEAMSLQNIVAEWEKDPKIVFASEANYTAKNPALSEAYKNNASLSSEVKEILNGGTILMESTSTPDLSGNMKSTIFIKSAGSVYKIEVSSSAIITHQDKNKYMDEALSGTNRKGFTETTEELSNTITAIDSVE